MDFQCDFKTFIINDNGTNFHCCMQGFVGFKLSLSGTKTFVTFCLYDEMLSRNLCLHIYMKYSL